MAEKRRYTETLIGEEAEEAEEVHLDPLATAAAFEASRNDPVLSRRLAHYIAIQSEHLHEQRELQLSRLKLRRFSDRVRVVTQLCVMIVAASIVAGLAILVVQAARSRSVVIAPFEVPPGLAARGFTGKVVANGLLDELIRMQAETRSTAEKRQLTGAWTNDIAIEVPETGVSVADIDQMLRQRLGHDIRIDGEITEEPAGGLELAVRADGIPPRSFAGGTGELGRLYTAAAEYIFSRSEPQLFAAYLDDNARWPEAAAFSEQQASAASGVARAYFLDQWGVALEQVGGSLPVTERLYKESLRLDPAGWSAYENLSSTQVAGGREEEAWRTMRQLERAAGGNPGRARPGAFENLDLLVWNLSGFRHDLVGSEQSGQNTEIGSDAASLADIDTRLHDRVAADLDLAEAKRDVGDPTVPAITHFVHGLEAEQDGDAARAAAEMEAFGAAMQNPAVGIDYAGYDCWIAPAEEAAGNRAKADAVLAGAHFVDCLRFRGDILDGRGAWNDAQHAYADGVALAPDLPAAYYSWGVALARHGDFAGAVDKLAAAHARGPDWADPLKAWGDVLARQGRTAEARAKYDAALALAPNWPALQQARARVSP